MKEHSNEIWSHGYLSEDEKANIGEFIDYLHAVIVEMRSRFNPGHERAIDKMAISFVAATWVEHRNMIDSHNMPLLEPCLRKIHDNIKGAKNKPKKKAVS